MHSFVSTFKRLMPVAIVAAGSLSISSASLIYQSSIQLSAQGFGSAPRALTIQGNGTESGCISVVAGAIAGGSGSCIADATIAPNGVANQGGAEVSPLSDNQKFGIPTLLSLGIDGANDIGILFNATEPGGNAITVTDLTLKFFDANSNLLGAIDTAGAVEFLTTNPGNGVAGFVFTIDAAQQLAVAGFITPTTRLALEATLTGAAGGPESFAIVNLNAPPPGGDPGDVPEPMSMALLGSGMAALVFFRKKIARG